MQVQDGLTLALLLFRLQTAIGHEYHIAITSLGAADDGTPQQMRRRPWWHQLRKLQGIDLSCDRRELLITGHLLGRDHSSGAELQAEGSPAADSVGTGDVVGARLLQRLRSVVSGDCRARAAEPRDALRDVVANIG